MLNYTPIFILGNPRSGTSLFRLMLNNHPEIVSPPECGFVQWWYDKYKYWSKEDNSEIKIHEFLKDLFSSKKFETWQLDRDLLLNIILEEKPNDFQDLTACVYFAYAGIYKNIRIISDKNNYYLDHLDALLSFWPKAKIIHLIRDGRDVACSYLDLKNLETTSVYKPKLTSSINSIALEWNTNNMEIMRLKENENGYLLVKYEDLITRSKESLTRVCRFLGIEYSNEMLNYYKETEKNRIEPNETKEWKVRTRKKPDRTRIGRYNQYFSHLELNAFNRIASEALKTFKYD